MTKMKTGPRLEVAYKFCMELNLVKKDALFTILYGGINDMTYIFVRATSIVLWSNGVQ
jgi:hypothetical protein